MSIISMLFKLLQCLKPLLTHLTPYLLTQCRLSLNQNWSLPYSFCRYSLVAFKYMPIKRNLSVVLAITYLAPQQIKVNLRYKSRRIHIHFFRLMKFIDVLL